MDERLVDPKLACAVPVIALFLTLNAVRRKGQGSEPRERDLIAALRTDPIAALFQPVEREIDVLEALLSTLDQTRVRLNIRQRARRVHFISRRRNSLLLLVAAKLTDSLQREVAFMTQDRTQLLESMLVIDFLIGPHVLKLHPSGTHPKESGLRECIF